MNENEIGNPLEDNPVPTEERNDQMPDMHMEPSSSTPDDDQEPQEGLSFKWVNLVIGVAICLAIGSNALTDDWTFYIYLSIVIVIHEMGHVIAG